MSEIVSQAQSGETGRQVTLSDSAAKRVAWLIEQEDQPNLRLRVRVDGGGCSGFQYGFSFDDRINDDDHLFARDGVELVVDDVSLDLINGSEIDYVEELIGAAFAIRNPNATSACSCGSSFAV